MVFLQFQGAREMFEDDASSDIDKVMAQLQWKFSNIF